MEHKSSMHRKNIRSHRRTASENLDELCFRAEFKAEIENPKQPGNDNQRQVHERNYSIGYAGGEDH